MADTPPQIEKIMSATLGDFQRSLATLAPGHTLHPDGRGILIEEDGYKVEIRFEPIESKVYGGLLEIPRAKVTLTFDNASPQARKKFVSRFDFAFQRGGG